MADNDTKTLTVEIDSDTVITIDYGTELNGYVDVNIDGTTYSMTVEDAEEAVRLSEAQNNEADEEALTKIDMDDLLVLNNDDDSDDMSLNAYLNN